MVQPQVGRQLINYNNTILADSEWRNQGRSYERWSQIFTRAGIASESSRRRRWFRSQKESAITWKATTLWSVRRNRKADPEFGMEPFFMWRVQPKVGIGGVRRARPASRMKRRTGCGSKARRWEAGLFGGVDRGGRQRRSEQDPRLGNVGRRGLSDRKLGGKRECSYNTITQAATKIPATEGTARSTRCIRRRTIVSESPTSSAGRTSSPGAWV